MIFKKIRDLLISSLVLEIVAVILGIVAFYKHKEIFTNSSNGASSIINSFYDAFSKDYVSLGLLVGFLLLSFIAFFLLPTIAASHYATKLEVGHRNLKRTTVLSTAASLVFLPFVVFAWPITLLIGIGQSDVLYKRHKAINKKDNKKEDEEKPNTNVRSNVVDLTTPVAPTTDTNVNPTAQPNQTVPPMNGPIGIARPVPSNAGVYRPGQNSGVPRPASPYARPTSSGSVYVRDANGQRRI